MLMKKNCQRTYLVITQILFSFFCFLLVIPQIDPQVPASLTHPSLSRLPPRRRGLLTLCENQQHAFHHSLPGSGKIWQHETLTEEKWDFAGWCARLYIYIYIWKFLYFIHFVKNAAENWSVFPLSSLSPTLVIHFYSSNVQILKNKIDESALVRVIFEKTRL